MRDYSLVELIDIITRYIGDFEAQFIREIGEAGLTIKQLHYIDAVNRLKHPTLTELAGELSLSKPSVTAIVEKLVHLGYIEKVRSDEDRRAAHVHLTVKGREIIDSHNEAHRKIASFFESSLDRKDIRTLEGILNKAVTGLKK